MTPRHRRRTSFDRGRTSLPPSGRSIRYRLPKVERPRPRLDCEAMPPRDVLWDLDPHTIAKHRILRRYVDAWLPIMASYPRRLVLIDGFAGPGRYRGGEDGSPVILLKAYLEHQQRVRLDR